MIHCYKYSKWFLVGLKGVFGGFGGSLCLLSFGCEIFVQITIRVCLFRQIFTSLKAEILALAKLNKSISTPFTLLNEKFYLSANPTIFYLPCQLLWFVLIWETLHFQNNGLRRFTKLV